MQSIVAHIFCHKVKLCKGIVITSFIDMHILFRDLGLSCEFNYINEYELKKIH
jgi:hypothetical protein